MPEEGVFPPGDGEKTNEANIESTVLLTPITCLFADFCFCMITMMIYRMRVFVFTFGGDDSTFRL